MLDVRDLVLEVVQHLSVAVRRVAVDRVDDAIGVYRELLENALGVELRPLRHVIGEDGLTVGKNLIVYFRESWVAGLEIAERRDHRLDAAHLFFRVEAPRNGKDGGASEGS